jgi:hypothetical protein
MKSSGSGARSRGTRVLGIMAVASLLSGLLSSFAFSAEPRKPSSLETKPSSAEMKAWRATMTRTPQPKPGCFEATYPSTEWQEVACTTAPNGTYAPAQGSNDFAAEVAGTISSAVGSFDDYAAWSPNNTGLGTPSVEYSLQLNTNFFTTSLCNGAANPANCKGWQQFVYSAKSLQDSTLFIQYWLIDYGSCPTGWTARGSHCSKSTSPTPVPYQYIFNLRRLTLTGTVGSGGAMDTATLGGGTQPYLNTATESVFDLASKWKVAEFNVFGEILSPAGPALFGSNSRIVVRTSVNDGSMNAPTCVTQSFSDEKNNLSRVPPCCLYGGGSPAIVFTQSNSAGATSMCANGTSVGEPHLTNFNGLLYDFQASGDFLLAEIDPDFVVQTRQKSGAPTWPDLAVNKAVAMKMGKTRLAICLKPTHRAATIFRRFVVDGKPNDLGNGKSLSLPGVTVSRSGNVYVFTRPDGANVRVVLNHSWLDVSVGLGSIPMAKVRGLLGNANGNAGADDLAMRDGSLLRQPVSFTDLYRFGDSWRVSSDESLLSQLCGEKNMERDIPKKPFYAKDLNPKVYERARRICTSAGVKEEALLDACTLDTAVLGDRATMAFVRANRPRAVVRLGSRSQDAR